MQIDQAQLAGKPRKVGTRAGKPVMELATKGGLHLIVSSRDGRFETLGTGPHRAVARFIAKKKAPEIQWTDLSKADHIEPEHFMHLVPRYEALTQELRKAHGDE